MAFVEAQKVSLDETALVSDVCLSRLKDSSRISGFQSSQETTESFHAYLAAGFMATAFFKFLKMSQVFSFTFSEHHR